MDCINSDLIHREVQLGCSPSVVVLGGGLVGLVAVRVVVLDSGEAVATLTVGRSLVAVADLLLLSGLLVGGGSGLAVASNVAGIVSIVVLSPDVVVGTHLSGVVLVGVGLGIDAIVRLAPSGVEVGAGGLLGPLVVVVGTLGGTVLSGGSLVLLGDSAVGTVLGTVAVAVSVTVASVLGTVAVAVVVTLGGGCAVGGSTVEITVLAPRLSAPLVVVGVVPLVVGFSTVGLGVGVGVRLIDGEVLVAAEGVPVGAGLGPGTTVTLLGGTVAGASLSVAVASVTLVLGGSGLAVAGLVAGVVSVVVVSPDVVVSADLSRVVLVVVGLGVDAVVRLAPSGVEVLAVSLLGPLVVVVSGFGGTVLSGSTLPRVGLGTVGSAVAFAVAVTGVLGTVAVAVVVAVGGGLAVGGGTDDIAVLAP